MLSVIRNDASIRVISLELCVGFAVKWQIARQYLKRFVDHRYFSRGILLAILVNTLSMGIEYHNQVSSFHDHLNNFLHIAVLVILFFKVRSCYV